MKKLRYILIIIMCIFLSGCGDEKKETDSRPSIILEDKTAGLTTTWKYEENEKYSYHDSDYQGKYKEIIVRNENLNMRITLYYFETTNEIFTSSKENRRNRPGFKEYNWNGYDGYAYNGDSEKISFQILLNTNEELNRTMAIAGEVNYLEQQNANVTETFNEEAFQKFMNTIEYRER